MYPASTTKAAWPITKLASGLHGQRTAAATSSGRASRPIGWSSQDLFHGFRFVGQHVRDRRRLDTACGFLWRHICRVVVVLIVHEDPPVAVRARVRGSSIQRSMLPAFQVAISKLRFSMFFDVSVPRLNQFEERRSIRHRGLLFSRDPAQPSAFLRQKSMPACQSLLRSSVARLLKRPAKMQSAFGTTRADRLGGFCSGGFPQPRRMVFAFRRGEHQCPETDEDIRLSIVQWNKQKLLSVHNGWLTSNKEMVILRLGGSK